MVRTPPTSSDDFPARLVVRPATAFGARKVSTDPGTDTSSTHRCLGRILAAPSRGARACGRLIILFDQPGTGRSSSGGEEEIPTTFQGWADNVLALIDALGLEQVDLFGFSMGGCAVQMVALSRPGVVRKLIIAGSGPSAPSSTTTHTFGERSGTEGIVWPRDVPPQRAIALLSAGDGTVKSEVEKGITVSFFPDTDAGRAAARAYFSRIYLRSPATITGGEGEEVLHTFLDAVRSARQRKAYAEWSATDNPRNSFDRLGELGMPVLVLNGDDDLLIPTSRCWELLRGIADAQVIIYPRAGHGFLWQYALRVAGDVGRFLDEALGVERAIL
ncbi:hypothetical protein LTR91_024052 [Friedmanniomyces endolithicus]|uniref:AB hydrolase-1 domain-containing protein n=1 Tax=Friedmanniomyces endolithicus TaxID=329885 RepID=A0AAN6JXS3_9PEZI|nr:hypothetical protein LTR94_022147 [Friedmanniomyces endolithicus]KAK0768819.1 hypothetical protein LTR59_017405 [Friedmanniomyces endolithicus]KAK0771041.1 hypothetical protein LTR38_017367 [Friedmanniomyces endolithicus]KAK0773128.1 hypothetical protein LTR75_017216 [Friedmanniomyces endolithicus]KAK0856003.1 hypothetical protein LTS02_010804 [Friedmanniomyces endolithicus]